MADTNRTGKNTKSELVRSMEGHIQNIDINKMTGSSEPVVYENVEETLNIPYFNRDKNALTMDMFKPRMPEGAEIPVIIVIHGSGSNINDRTAARPYCRKLAHENHMVFSIEYRLAPKANVCQALDDVCSGINLADRMIADHNINCKNCFLISDSAGSYMAAYISSMNGSQKLQEAIGHESTRIKFTAVGIMSGMFYTDQEDPTSNMLSDQMFGEERAEEDFLKYMNSEIISNIPPVFLVMSRGGLMNNYMYLFNNAMEKAGRITNPIYYDENDLNHFFALSAPEQPKSIEVTKKMLAWFNKQAEINTAKNKKSAKTDSKLEKLERRMADGSINNQQINTYIKERRSFSEAELKKIAIIDCSREYTYAEMFEMWENYAKVFTALNITAENKSRAAIAGTLSAEPLFAFYALNITGAEASMFSYTDFVSGGNWRYMLENEKITDLLISDIVVTPELWKEICQAKEELGLRNVILMHSPMGGPTLGPVELMYNELNYNILKRIPGVKFMRALVKKYKDTEIKYYNSDGDNIALLTHTSGTTKGSRKPLPYKNKSINSISTIAKKGFHTFTNGKDDDSQLRVLVHFDFSSSLAMNGLINTTFTGGDTLVLTFFGFIHPRYIRSVDYYKINIFNVGGFMIDKWLDRHDYDDISFESVNMLGLGGSYTPLEKVKRYTEFFRAHGYKYNINRGYGMSEAGSAQLMISADCDEDILGYPPNDDIARVKDENDGKFYRISEGVRTGIIYLYSNSICENTLDGKTLFEYEVIDGKNFVCTNDIVRVNENGSVSYAGRADKYFVNGEGKKFDSGVVDAMVAAHPAIDRCAVVPIYEKRMHDAVPVLYVIPVNKNSNSAEIVKNALKDVYIRDKKVAPDNLPFQFIVVDDIPLNSNGKLDIYRITRQRLQGDAYNIVPVFENGELTDITTEYIAPTTATKTAGKMPEGTGGGSAYNIYDILNSVPPTSSITSLADMEDLEEPSIISFKGIEITPTILSNLLNLEWNPDELNKLLQLTDVLFSLFPKKGFKLGINMEDDYKTNE